MRQESQTDGSRTWLAAFTATDCNTGWDRYAQTFSVILPDLGEPTSLTELMGISGNAFHLCFLSDWQVPASPFMPVDPAARIAAAYGFSGRWLHHGHRTELIEHLEKTERRCLSDAIFEQIAAEISLGRPVLLQDACGAEIVIGFDRQNQELCRLGPNSVRTWTPVLAANRPGYWQGVVRGAVRQGFYGGPLVNPVFCLGRQSKVPSERDRIQEALEQAVVSHFGAPVEFQQPFCFTCSFGDLAYQSWAEALAVWSDTERSDTAESRHFDNLYFLVDCIISGRRAASDFCRQAADILFDAAADLVAAADTYNEEVELAERHFADLTTADADSSLCLARLSDPAQRQADAAAVRALLDLERRAVAHLQGGLLVLAGIEQEGSRLWIRNVPELQPQAGKDCFFAGALEAALAVSEYPMDYRDIVCYSGLATRINWYVGTQASTPRWDRSCAVGERPSSHQPLQKASGWRFQPIMRRGWPDMTEFVPLVIDAIDSGRPVPCYLREPRMGVVFGYADQGQTLLCRSYDAPETTVELPVAELGWLIYLIDQHSDPPPSDECFQDTLRLILRQWHSPTEITRGGELLSGRAAYRRWIADLQSADDLEPEAHELLFSVNWYVFHAIADVRQQVAPFLREGADWLPAAAQQHVEAAAQAFDQLTSWARSAYEMHDAFPGPWADASSTDWTPAIREREIQLLTDMLACETAAMEHLEFVLAACRDQKWTSDKLTRLEQWSNLFGELSDCIRAADREPIFYDLLDQEIKEPASSEFVTRMRRSMGQLDPTDQSYGDQIDTLMASLAAGRFVQPWPDGATPARRYRVKQLAKAMELWLTGKSRSEAKRAGAGESATDEVYGLLGEFDASKKRPLAMTIQKLRTGELPADLEELRDDSPSAPLAAQLAHNIASLAIQSWTFEHNLKVLLNSIGAKQVIAPWGDPHGPIPWGGIQALNPSVKPRLREAIDELETWLQSDTGSTSQLGGHGEYPGKIWLGRCLLTYLQHHIVGHF